MNNRRVTKKSNGFYWASVVLLLLAMILALGAAFSGFGTRLGIWHFKTGFKVLKYSAYGGFAVGIASISLFIMSIRRRLASSIILTLAALTLGCAVFAVPASWWYKSKKVPVINDITTDTSNPPQFSALLSQRFSGVYGGMYLALKQRSAYPDIQPLILNMPSEEAYTKALESAEKMGWKIEAENANEKKIEAIDTTFWFGFKDDIVVRLTPVEGNARTVVDVRSASREGASDIGTNAERIRRYFKELSS